MRTAALSKNHPIMIHMGNPITLGHITRHVKEHNSFAVELDFLIVAFGVLQVSNWNAAQPDKHIAQDYIYRIQVVLSATKINLSIEF